MKNLQRMLLTCLALISLTHAEATPSNDVTESRTITIGVENPGGASQERAGIQLGRLKGTTGYFWCNSDKVFPGNWSTTTQYGYTAVQASNCSDGDVCIEVTISSGSNVNASVYQSDGAAANPYDPSNIATNYLSDGATTGTTVFNATVSPGIFEVVFTNVTVLEQSSVTFHIKPNYPSEDSDKIYYVCPSPPPPTPIPLSSWSIILGVFAIALFMVARFRKRMI